MEINGSILIILSASGLPVNKWCLLKSFYIWSYIFKYTNVLLMFPCCLASWEACVKHSQENMQKGCTGTAVVFPLAITSGLLNLWTILAHLCHHSGQSPPWSSTDSAGWRQLALQKHCFVPPSLLKTLGYHSWSPADIWGGVSYRACVLTTSLRGVP